MNRVKRNKEEEKRREEIRKKEKYERKEVKEPAYLTKKSMLEVCMHSTMDAYKLSLFLNN